VDIVKVARKEAEKVIKQCSCDRGFKASGLETGYPQVWARDSMITLLGAILLDQKDIKPTVVNSLRTLRSGQTDLGLIPASVVLKDGMNDFRAYIDGNAWYVIGHAICFKKYGDKSFLEENWESIQKTLQWLECQDVYQSGLIAMQEGADWMDHVAIRGRGLYTNSLYYQALLFAAEIALVFGDDPTAEFYISRAERVKDQIQNLLWVDIVAQRVHDDDFRNEELNILYGHKQALLRERPYFLPYVGFRTVGTWFDILGNVLAILTGIATEDQANQILDYVKQVGANSPFPAKAIYPTFRPGDVDWRDYYLNKNLNLPDQYHNGGIWPFVGGFYIAALVKANRQKEAEEMLQKLASANKKGKSHEWEFNEWLHGITGEPMGREFQAWSAGMYIFAFESVKQKSIPFF
jgi:glycogen debranching enzyme